MRYMESAMEQLTRLINSIPTCYANPVHDGFTLRCSSGVVWQQKKKEQWGHVHDKDNYMLIHIDAPCGKFTDSGLAKRLGLREKSYNGQIGSVDIYGGGSGPHDYERLEFTIGSSELKWLSFNHGPFPDLVREIASLSCVGVQELIGSSPNQSRVKDALYEIFPEEHVEIDELLEQELTGIYAVPDTVGERKLRVGHQLFAERVKENYQFRCAVTGICTREFLVASHIVPWSHDHTIRLDPSNGICLSILVDRAFDQGFLEFDEDYRACLSPRVKTDPVLNEYLVLYEGKKLELPDISPPRERE